MTTAQKKTRSLGMHSQLLFSVIERQAGSLTKALLEGVMNAVDAGATECKVVIKGNKATIKDDGKGFRSDDEIQKFFETFGQPHDESENKVYGAFRMGRGQMFAFGLNRWRSGKFQMEVDIKGKGLAYDLTSNMKAKKGCDIHIDLYKELMPSEIQTTINDLKRWVVYAPIPIYINNKLVSIDPSTQKWTYETDEAYILVKNSGALSIYNLGILVSDYAGYRLGVAGIVVSKKQIRVNFARNDIQSDCKVFNKIKPLLKKEAKKKQKNTRRRWNDEERQFAVDQYLSSETPFKEFITFPVFTDITGSHSKVEQTIDKIDNKYNGNISSGETGSIKGDKVMQSRSAFVFSNDTLNRFHCNTLEEMTDAILEIANQEENYCTTDKLRKLENMKHLDFEELTKGIDDSCDIHEEKKNTMAQRIILKVLEQNHDWFLCAMRRKCGVSRDKRNLMIGRSHTSSAWTNGSSYIAFEERYFKSLNMTPNSWHNLIHLLVHEYCHDTNTTGSHVHDRDFYETYHNLSDIIGQMTESCITLFPCLLEKENRRITKNVLKYQDAGVRQDRALREAREMAEGANAAGDAPTEKQEQVAACTLEA